MNPNYLDWESNRPAGTHGNVQLMQKQPATVADLDQKKFKRMFFQDILHLMQERVGKSVGKFLGSAYGHAKSHIGA
jgi:hypothetical protein